MQYIPIIDRPVNRIYDKQWYDKRVKPTWRKVSVRSAMGKDKWLMYDPDAKVAIRAGQNNWLAFFRWAKAESMREIRELTREPQLGTTYKNGSIEVRRYYPCAGSARTNIGTWKVQIGDDEFFVKEMPSFWAEDTKYINRGESEKPERYTQSGPVQYMALTALRFIQIDKVEAVRPIFAYSDKESSFIVTRFLNMENLGSGIALDKIPPERIRDFARFALRAEDLKIYDMLYEQSANFNNIFYSGEQDKLVVVDPIYLLPREKLLQMAKLIEYNHGWFYPCFCGLTSE